MKEQEPENKADKNDKKMPKANCACTLKTCGKEGIKRETCVDILAQKELLACDEGISPTKLNEMINKEINDSIKRINNSIRDAVQTLVKQCSMEEEKPISSCSKEPQGKSHVCRARVLEEHCKKSSNVCINRQATSHASRQHNELFTHSNSYPCTKMHESAIPLPVKNKSDSDRKSKKHSKSGNNMNTDNRRMTGNVNIYICSETNDNGQEKSKIKSIPELDTRSNTTTEQSNSRSVSASSASSCKLINSLKEKRKKLQAQQLLNFIHEKSSDDNIVCNNRTLQRRIYKKKPSKGDSKEEVDVKVSDGNVECKNTISSIRDDCYCKDTDNMDLQQDSSYSIVPCSNFSASDNTRRPQSWITIYPSEAKTRLDDDILLSSAICTNVERRNYRKNDDRKDDSDYTVCHAIDGSRWLPKSIYTDCATYDEDSKECFIDGCKYRNKILQDSVINRNDIRKRQMGYKHLQQPLGSCQRELVIRRWSTCSCIAEEEEDSCKGVDRIDKELLENVRSDKKCSEKMSVCQTPSRNATRKLAESAVVRETSFGIPGERFEKTCKGTFEDSAECLKGTTVYGTRFRNSEEPPKVTRVCKEFVTEEPPEDIAVCKTVLRDSKGSPEANMALPDSKETPKETICKEIPNSNFANRDDVKRLFLNDAKDKPVEESTNSSNLNNQKENAGNKRILKLNNKYDNVALNNFTEQSANRVKQDKQIKEISNDKSKNSYRIPLGSINNSKPKNIYSTILPHAQFYNRSNLVPYSNIKKTSKTLNQQRIVRMQSYNRPIRNYFQQQSNNFTKDLASSKNNQLEEKTQEKSKEEKETQDISKEIGTTDENKLREPLLHRSYKKLIGVIRRGKMLITDRIETGKIEAKKTIVDGKNHVEKSETVSEIEDKISDIKDQQDVTKEVSVPMRSQTDTENGEMTRKILVPKPTAPAADLTIPEKVKKMGIQKTDQAMPKLLRIITAKRSHLLPTVITTDSKPQDSEVVSVPAKIITNAHINQEEIPEEKVISQEHIPAEVTEEIKADDSIASKTSIAEIETVVEDAPKDTADRVPKSVLDETTKIYVACPQKKSEKELQKPILCKCGLLSDPSGRSCLIAKCAKHYVPCPQKKSGESQKSILYKRELPSDPNSYLCSVIKCTKYNNTVENCPYKDSGSERMKVYCMHCRLSTVQCTCAPIPYLKSCLKADKPKFRDISPLKISSHVCTNCCRARDECKCRKTAVCCRSHGECRYRWCATRGNCSRIIDEPRYEPQASCINCGRPRDECCCAALALVKCHKIKEGCYRKKTMICLYCDNTHDKCTCRAPIGKCSYCGLPSDVCNCQDDEGHARDRERTARRPDETRAIRVTSWKPRREIRQYFARNFEDFRPNSTEECRCYEKSKQQHPEELPYQRLNIFSDVMNELQQKMSESVSYTRCWRNPCRCASPVNQDKRKRDRKAEDRVRCARKEKSPRSKSPNNCRYNLSPRNERKNIVQKSIPIRHLGCVCKLSPCRCKKDRPSCKRPLAKCYYCKSLPCTCITVK